MKRRTLGNLPPRYSLLLNQHPDVRLSKCPKCERPTHPRKFALFVHVDGWGPLVVGKTCGYCTPCEMVFVHRHELEAELARSPARLPPHAQGHGYFVVGTVDRKVWQKGLEGGGTAIDEILAHTADFKKHYDLHYQPAGWYRAEDR